VVLSKLKHHTMSSTNVTTPLSEPIPRILQLFGTNVISFSTTRYIGKLLFSQLIEIPLEIPSVQRVALQGKVDEIVQTQLAYYKSNKIWNFMGVINFHLNQIINTTYLVDGQHRIEAARQLYKMGHDIELAIELIIISHPKTIKLNWDLLNKNTELPEYVTPEYKPIADRALSHFATHHSLVSDSNNKNRPNIFHVHLQTAFGDLIHKLKINDADVLIDLVNKYNNWLSEQPWEYFPKPVSRQMLAKAQKHNLFLGLYKYDSERGFDWVHNIIAQATNNPVKKSRKTVPSKLKHKVWEKCFGITDANGNCVCCHERINIQKYHASHIKSVKNGGLTNMSNLVPCCSGCNLSMGATNMDEYIRDYHPENLKNFNNMTKKIVILL
jgi:hypothetical protein